VRLHGVPVALLSDRDPRFTAQFWKQFHARMGTQLLMSTSYHPETDGQTENSNKTLESVLRSVVSFEQRDWDDHLTLAEFAVNNSVNATTKTSAFWLNYGREVRTPADVALLPSRPDLEKNNEAAEGLTDRLRSALEQATKNIAAAQQRQAHYANQHRREESFKFGDQVLLSTENIRLLGESRRTPKLAEKFIGPYRIIKGGPNAYELDLPASSGMHPVVNISRLKRYHDGAAAFPDRPVLHPRPPPVSADGDVYDAKRIVDSRVTRNKRQYLVLWEGFPDEEASWEPAENLTGSQELIAEYEARETVHPRVARRAGRSQGLRSTP
jgi:hypothetical protein